MIQLIAELGGGAAIMRLALGMWAESQKRQVQRDESMDVHAQRILQGVEGVLEFIFCGMAVCSFVLLLSTVLLPLIIKDVQIVFLLSENRSFLFFDWDKLREYTWGEGAASRRIVILPFQIAACTNFVSFFLTGRAMRTR
jgi:ABC-type multidrug transport system permease subunit